MVTIRPARSQTVCRGTPGGTSNRRALAAPPAGWRAAGWADADRRRRCLRRGRSWHPAAGAKSDGWCWYNPLPSGNYLQAIAGAGRTDLWIGGETFISGPSSNALHFDGGRWNLEPSPLGIIDGIWAASEDDVWFVGDDTAFTGMGAIAHWDGAAITLATSVGAEVVTDVWGSGASDVYAVGGDYGRRNEIAVHWDGAAWTPIPGGVGGRLVDGSGPSDVWIGGPDGLMHFDGASWSPVVGLEGQWVTALAVAGPGDVFAGTTAPNGEQLTYRLDASGLRVVLIFARPSRMMLALGASSPQNVWVVGAADGDGLILHYDGTDWLSAPDYASPLQQVAHVPGFGDIAVGARGGIVRLTAGAVPGYTDLRLGSDTTLAGVFGSSPSDMWAVGDAGTVWHHDGTAVSAIPAGTSVNLKDVWGTGPNDVWAVGDGGTVLHFDGSAFAPVASGTTVDLKAVFTVRPDDVWIGGDGPTLLHWDGTSMTPVTLAGADPGGAVFDLHGIAAGDIWLSGGSYLGAAPQGYVAHFDGTAWSPVERLTFSIMSMSPPLLRVWQLAADDVWVTAGQLSLRGGGPDAYMHFDGTAWTELLQDPTTVPQPVPPFVFPNRDRPSFVFGPHDRWRADFFGIWQRNSN